MVKDWMVPLACALGGLLAGGAMVSAQIVPRTAPAGSTASPQTSGFDTGYQAKAVASSVSRDGATLFVTIVKPDGDVVVLRLPTGKL